MSEMGAIMFDQNNLETFKDDLIDKITKSRELPILASIGKQSKGKSFFLGHFLNDPSLPNKHGKLIQKGTLNLFAKSYLNLGFTLFDMEGLESEENDSKRDSFNFCSVFAISDIIILNISHDDLENQIFIDTFSFNYWRYCMTSINLKQRKLYIILCIRDPRWSDESIKVLDSYKKLVEEFCKTVNLKINELTEHFACVAEPFLGRECENPEDVGCGDLIINRYKRHMKNFRFTVDEHFIIFFKKCYGKKIAKYYELVKINNQDAEFRGNSRFENMMRFIRQKCNEIRNTKNMKVEFEFSEFKEYGKIMNLIEMEMEDNLSKKNIVREIFIQALYDPIMHYSNANGLIRIMESYYKLSKKIQDISEEIVLYVNKESITENNYKKFRLENEGKLNIAIQEEKLSNNIIAEIYGYLKILSAKSCMETFKLSIENPERITYQMLMFFIKYGSYQEIINHQLKEFSKRKLIYKCSPYFDSQFKEILATLYKSRVNIFQSIYEIYKEVIRKSCEMNYQYQEIIDTEINDLKEQVNFRTLFKFIDSLEIEYSQRDVEDFIKIFMKIHREKLLAKKNRLNKFKSDSLKRFAIIDRNVIFDSIPALYISEKVYPSICGLFISFLDNRKENILADLAKLSAANHSVLGWTVFGKTKINSFSWSFSFAFGKSSKNWVGYKKYAQEGYEVFTLIGQYDLTNGRMIDLQNFISKDFKMSEKWYYVEHLKIDPLTTVIKATFYAIQIGENTRLG
ncbi:hypothetical protein SteCoe_6510 [Stentor coeruleus]|uniref:Uncharacterized protein n=1 Tax=Stentor coeruleus TaxID=5963 RepID=A0A1R2CPX7_9CILI|nr:hypothetical protein SteCoe_6510 [Stentor coeruleus]